MLIIGADVNAPAGVKRKLQRLKSTHTPALETLMLSVLWGSEEQLIRDFLPIRRAITAAICCQQLNRVAQQFKEKQDRIYILHDNARTHVEKLSREKLPLAGLKNHAPSTVFSILDSNRLSLLSASLKQSARTGVRQREGPKSRHRHFLCLEVW